MSEQSFLYISLVDQTSVIGFSCSAHTIVLYNKGEMKVSVLSPIESKALETFFQLFPDFVPSQFLIKALNIEYGADKEQQKYIVRLLAQVRKRIRPLGIEIRCINQIGYFLEINKP